MPLYPLIGENSLLHQWRKQFAAAKSHIVQGTSGDDVYEAPQGEALYDGGAGYDIVLFSKDRKCYTLSSSNLSMTISDSVDTAIRLMQVEELRFYGNSDPIYVNQHNFHLDFH